MLRLRQARGAKRREAKDPVNSITFDRGGAGGSRKIQQSDGERKRRGCARG